MAPSESQSEGAGPEGSGQTPVGAAVGQPVAHNESVRHSLSFHGEGREFFRIWIVNLALTVLTLGIFSAWAKVRTKRYFYGNTELAGDRFDYLANPIAILKGRLIAVAALALYTLAQTFSPMLTGVLLLVFFLALPLLVVRALKFGAAMTAWRGLRFGFDGTLGGAAAAYLGWPLFGVVTLGFGMPYAWGKQNHFLVNHYRFGTTSAKSTATIGDFYVIALVLGGLLAVGVVALMILTGIVAVIGGAASDQEGAAAMITIVLMMVSYLLLYVLVYVLYQALYFQTVYNNIEFDDHLVRNSVKPARWLWIALTNSLGILLTLGFYYPWARVRMTRYILSNLWVATSSLDDFEAHETDVTTAFGEEMGEAFDLGIGI